MIRPEARPYSMRSKEQAHDYRYFPEPDLLPLVVGEKAYEIRSTLPELPEARRKRLVADYGITEQDAAVLTSSRHWRTSPKRPESREESQARGQSGARRTNGTLKAKDLEIGQSPISMGAWRNPPIWSRAARFRQDAQRSLRPVFRAWERIPAVYERTGTTRAVSRHLSSRKDHRRPHRRQPNTGRAISCRQENSGGFFVGRTMKASKG